MNDPPAVKVVEHVEEGGNDIHCCLHFEVLAGAAGGKVITLKEVPSRCLLQDHVDVALALKSSIQPDDILMMKAKMDIYLSLNLVPVQWCQLLFLVILDHNLKQGELVSGSVDPRGLSFVDLFMENELTNAPAEMHGN